MTTAADRDALVARLRKIQSVGGSLLSNATAAIVAAQAITVTDEPAPPDPAPQPTPRWPGPTNTGARVSPTRTLTGEQALAEALAGGGHLSSVKITGLTIDEAQHAGLTFTDCIIENSGPYALRSFYTSGAPDGGRRNVFDHCTIRCTNPTSGATVIGSHFELHACDVSGGVDLAKPFRDYLIDGSWLHDTWHVDGAHCDVIQIVSGTGGVVRGNTLSGFNHPDSPSAGGQPCSGVLQTGTLTADVQAEWVGNLIDGGGYALRGATASGLAGHTQALTFRGNKFGRGSRYGPVTNMGGGADLDASNVWADTGQPIT